MPNINKNIIKQAGAAVANATNNAAGLTAATPEPGTIISAIQLVNGGRTIGPDAIAHFTESVRNKLLSLMVAIEPTQDLHGYDHPWPGGGGVNKWDEEWEVGTINSGVNSASSVTLRSKNYIPVVPGATYYFSGPNNKTKYVYCYDSGKAYINTSITVHASSTFTVPNGCSYIRFAYTYYIQDYTTYNHDIAINYPSTVTTYSPYSNICPISGRTGANAYISPTPNVADATTYAADWTTPAGTVYAGSADIVTGDIKAAPYYASYNGETLVGPWVSSMDEYDPEGTPTTGAQVVDLGGTMTEYHITGQDIITLVGDNYIWSDSGDVTITE